MKAARDVAAVDDNIGAFCSVDRKPRSLGEKEQDFLLAMQSFYESGKLPGRSWPVVARSAGGTWPGRLIPDTCCSPATAGKPVMSNEEFDTLKQELLWEGSQVAILSKDEQVRGCLASACTLSPGST